MHDDDRKKLTRHEAAVDAAGYPLLHRDFDLLKQIRWSTVILDEAQNVKNPETKQAHAARMIRADHRIALTGTPVENNVGELWSIMEFLNPGLLGPQAAFRRQFFLPIQTEGDADAIRRLKRLTGPFILRRLFSTHGQRILTPIRDPACPLAEQRIRDTACLAAPDR